MWTLHIRTKGRKHNSSPTIKLSGGKEESGLLLLTLQGIKCSLDRDCVCLYAFRHDRFWKLLLTQQCWHSVVGQGAMAKSMGMKWRELECGHQCSWQGSEHRGQPGRADPSLLYLGSPKVTPRGSNRQQQGCSSRFLEHLIQGSTGSASGVRAQEFLSPWPAGTSRGMSRISWLM